MTTPPFNFTPHQPLTPPVIFTPTSDIGRLGPERTGNWDEAFDEMSTEPVAALGGGGLNPFTIKDATDGSTELIVVSPGLLEVINGGFSTFIVPTLGGDPITDQTPIAAVSGAVFLEVTINAGSGIPTTAAVKSAASLPADTATLKYIQLGTVTVGTSVVIVDSQDVNANVLYRAPLTPWTITATSDKFSVAPGLVFKSPLDTAPISLSAAGTPYSGAVKIYMEAKIVYATQVITAELKSASSWPAAFDTSDATFALTRVPLGDIGLGGVVTQLRTGPIVLAIIFTGSRVALSPLTA